MKTTWGDEKSSYSQFAGSENVTLGLFDRKQMLQAINEKYLPIEYPVDKTAEIFKVDNVDIKYKELKTKVVTITTHME